MALPVLAKTWQFNVNQLISEATIDLQAAAAILAMVNSFVGFGTLPWAVWGSCDGAGGAGSFGNGDGVNRWANAADIVISWGGNHSWMVLSNAASGQSICIDFLGVGSYYNFFVYVSWSAGFGAANGGTDGTAALRPTATDEMAIQSGGDIMWYQDAVLPWRIHVMHSTDGMCTYLVHHRNNVCLTFMMFGKTANPAGVTTGIAFARGGDDFLAYNKLSAGTAGVYSRIGASAAFGQFLTVESRNGSYGSLQQAFPDDDTGEWPMFPIGIFSLTGTHRGRKGQLFDLYWGSTVAGNGSTYPDDGSKVWAQFNAMIFPWNGSAPLTA